MSLPLPALMLSLPPLARISCFDVVECGICLIGLCEMPHLASYFHFGLSMVSPTLEGGIEHLAGSPSA
jgi:hypothetical protein